MSKKFVTDEEAKAFLVENIVGDYDIFATIEKIKSNDLIDESISEKMYADYEAWGNTFRDYTEREDLVKYLAEDAVFIESLHDAVVFLDCQLQDAKSKL